MWSRSRKSVAREGFDLPSLLAACEASEQSFVLAWIQEIVRLLMSPLGVTEHGSEVDVEERMRVRVRVG